MSKCSKLSRKISSFVLLAAMLLSMAKPVSIYAQDEGAVEKEDQKIVQDNVVQDNAAQDTVLIEQETQLTDIPKEETEANGQSGKNGQEAAGDASYDTNKPIIEGFKFTQQGKTLKKGDMLQFYVDAYDADSGIKTINISLENGGYLNTLSWDADTWKHDENNNQYVCEYTLENVNTEKVNISKIEVIDQNSNYAVWETRDENYEAKYWFNTEEDAPIKVKSIVFEQNGKVLNEEDTIRMTFELETAIEETYFDVLFKHEDGNGYSISAYRSEAEKTFEVEFEAVSFPNGKWTLDCAEIRGAGAVRKLLIDDAQAYSFTVEKSEAETDKEKPVIKSISIDKNGEICRPGDVVNVTVEAVDNETLSEYGSLEFYASADISGRSQYVSLEYDEQSKVYRGAWEITKDTYPCEWYISYINIYDSEYNYADYSKYTYEADYPYYINVYNGTTFVQPTYNISLNFMALNEEGYWTTVQTIQKDKVMRRQTLKDLGITFPELSVKYQDFEQVGWIDLSGKEVTEATQIVNNMGYMNVYAKYNKVLVTAGYNYVNKNGGQVYDSIKKSYPDGITYGEVTADLIKAEAPQEQHEGLTFQGWTVDNSGYEDDEPVRGGMQNFRISAEYDKNCVMFSYHYPNKDGQWVYMEQPVIMEKGKTYKEAIAEGNKYRPEDMETKSFEKWMCTGVINEDAPLSNYTHIYCNAKYEGKTALFVSRSYYNEEGRNISQQEVIYADDGASKEEVRKLLDEMDMPKMYEGLRFKCWGDIDGGNEFVNCQSISTTAEYENCIVRYLIDPIFNTDSDIYFDEIGIETVVCQTAEIGDKVSIPASFDGYENVTWVEKPAETETFEVTGHMTFKGYGVKTEGEPSTPEEPDKPEEPSIPEKPDKPGEPSIPEEPGKPSIPEDGTRPTPELIESVLNSIDITAEGETIAVDMGGATTVPKEILEAAKGKDVDIQLNMGGYSWTINGKDIMSSNLKDINLQVTMNTENIPNSTIQKLAGDNPVKQLSLAHEGDFGFKASLTVKMGEEYAGKYGNLFYHDSEGRMTFIDAGTIRPDGMVTLGFSHASDYVVVMSNEEMSQSKVPSELQPTGNKGDSDGSSNGSGSVRKSAKTGDSSNIMMLILCSIFAMGVIVYTKRRKFA